MGQDGCGGAALPRRLHSFHLLVSLGTYLPSDEFHASVSLLPSEHVCGKQGCIESINRVLRIAVIKPGI